MSPTPPNPRLQRARSASPPSPLSRQPLGVRKFCLGLLAISGLALTSPSPGPVTTGSSLRIFFPRLDLAKADGERIQNLEVRMACGTFRQVSIPNDWSLEVVSPVSEQTTL